LSKPAIKIAITIGDPAGIGPEVTLKAINELSGYDIVPLLIGRAEVLQTQYPQIFKDYIVIEKEKFMTFAASGISTGKKYFVNISSNNPVPVPGIGSIDTGNESRIYVDNSVNFWKQGLADAIVTGPVSKTLIEKSGCPFTGHTEYIASLINETSPYMMMFSEEYRVLLVTTHIPVSEIPVLVDADRIYKTIAIGNKEIGAIDGGNVRIAIAGLDPHCGDEGAIGDFDINVTKRVVEKARKEGINVEGPFAADTLFTPQKWKSYNLVIAHYHDQGLIPFKVLAFDTGVNVTLGLSIVRTSPDHGTAFDIAGKNIANHKSTLEAIKLAYKLACNRVSKT
jgi:4-phospho-D-threonate 3-dehydrogenase / 4-phospho-D-erythronate 3-dehydrogenase